MRKLRPLKVGILILLGLSSIASFAQQEKVGMAPTAKLDFPEKLIGRIERRAAKAEQKLAVQNEKYLRRLQYREEKIRNKIISADSSLAYLFSTQSEIFQKARTLVSSKSAGILQQGGEYLPYVDSIKGALGFLSANTAVPIKAVGDALAKFNTLNSTIAKSNNIKEMLYDRIHTLKELCNQNVGLAKHFQKELGRYQKEAFYYAEQIKSYKELFNEPDKLLLKGLAQLRRVPAFTTFMQQHSELAGLFNLPLDYNSAESLTGIQTKAQVQALIQNQAGGGTNAVQAFGQQINSAKAKLDQFKDKLTKLGANGGDVDMPNFRYNPNRTKSFLRFLEYGTTIQNSRATNYFPGTTDLSLQIGYKATAKITAGLGLGGKIGWGKDIQHIKLSAEGFSLRSFFDMQLKKTFYLSGGLEFNHQKPFEAWKNLYQANDWTTSGLVGLSKIISIKSKLFKKTKVQLLADLLSFQQKPRTQPLKFRVGYIF
jgi:hypothetical protein